MTLDKEDKQCLAWGFVVCFVIAAIVTFNVWMWRSPNRPEKPDSSNEAYNQSKIEAVKWKFKYDSVSVEYARIMAGIERKINNSNKKIKQNEITKKQDAALSDSAVYILRDSLRAEYRKRYFAKDSIASPRFFN
jgi:hypothetical protein